ncbi:MAG: hypothetical protein E5X13_05815, partial [Mesorhizobium sp.]
MRLIITDVTEMHGGNYCVAGWEAQGQMMIRPLPNGANWTAGLLQQHSIVPGATIDVVPTGQQHLSVYPHRTEDTPINGAGIQLVNAGPINWFAAGAPTTHGTVAAAFGGQVTQNSIWQNIRQGVHVQVGTQVASLGAIRLPRNSVQFLEEFDKLKVVLNDGTARYKLPISSLGLKAAWRHGGIAAVQQALPPSAQFHVRLGLARAFGNPPDKCYM